MYQAYWQLDSRPFEHSSDDAFFYAAESQRGALLKLRYVLENRRGAAVLAGESGLGKTLLAQRLLEELEPAFAPRVHLVFPQMPPDQLLTYLADQLTGQYSPITATIDQSVRRIERLLKANAQGGNHAVIAIDEAHLLKSAQSLETIRLLMNFQHEGQPVATCLLSRLSAEETGRYIHHRLGAAGGKRTIFEQSAIETIFALTHGIPRQINRLCDLALLVGYGEELRTIADQHIESIHQELIGSAAA
jgi:type II secretory pathway predicted ATPase ExeA